MEPHLHNNNQDYPHSPELDIITGKRQSVIGKWALPIMVAMAAIAIAVFAYVYIRISNY